MSVTINTGGCLTFSLAQEKCDRRGTTLVRVHLSGEPHPRTFLIPAGTELTVQVSSRDANVGLSSGFINTSTTFDYQLVDGKYPITLFEGVQILDIPRRVRTCLQDSGVRYIGELVQYRASKRRRDLQSPYALQRIPNLGPVAEGQIETALAKVALHLGMDRFGIEGIPPDPAQLEEYGLMIETAQDVELREPAIAESWGPVRRWFRM